MLCNVSPLPFVPLTVCPLVESLQLTVNSQHDAILAASNFRNRLGKLSRLFLVHFRNILFCTNTNSDMEDDTEEEIELEVVSCISEIGFRLHFESPSFANI